ncbi:MAG: Nif3-like dinuclear metal center hexameric protein [Bryobacteraceae bacterium]
MKQDTALPRRPLLLGGLGLSLSAAQAPAEPLTAAGVIEKIKANVGVPWREKTVDNLIAGSPTAKVKGIATTMMATLDVLERAHAAGRNMVITHESTFFSHQDTVDQLKQDKTYLHKRGFIEKNDMAVFHFHDHWHARRPDGIATGMMRELGWEKNVDPENQRLYTFPGIPLARLAADIEAKLKIRTMRVLGNPKLEVRRVMTSWGYVSQFPGTNFIARPDVDVLVVGETREWELVEYVQDQISSGLNKGLVVMGHVVSEQSGMKFCAEWLRGILPGVPVDFVAAVEPFWRPGEPV